MVTAGGGGGGVDFLWEVAGAVSKDALLGFFGDWRLGGGERDGEEREVAGGRSLWRSGGTGRSSWFSGGDGGSAQRDACGRCRRRRDGVGERGEANHLRGGSRGGNRGVREGGGSSGSC
ncbi:uncharacterized transmembrane protein DDB_G0289901-like [Schistocerca americana]|uniref:uncharacterized transmembrane protein DDB_G0289901-like n=1 Tax=Schistocerca americana TaxID=7009 RepID=UPI001F501F24|nr:uncharacterized transmembrane protein DDB_G0289901-like [Schistocerca americana]